MTHQLDEDYLSWLESQVVSVKSPSCWNLLKVLYTTEFVWFIPNDDNRVEDGRMLRVEFFDGRGFQNEHDWMELGCSVLEMLVALSRRLSFEDEGEPSERFWELLENLGLNYYTDMYIHQHEDVWEEIQDKLDTLIWRTYDHKGRGGLFPLEHPAQDQRDVEIWYQMSAYIIERD